MQCQNHKNQEIYGIHCQNYENHEKIFIPRQDNEIHEILEFDAGIVKFVNIYLFNTRITKIMKFI